MYGDQASLHAFTNVYTNWPSEAMTSTVGGARRSSGITLKTIVRIRDSTAHTRAQRHGPSHAHIPTQTIIMCMPCRIAIGTQGPGAHYNVHTSDPWPATYPPIQAQLQAVLQYHMSALQCPCIRPKARQATPTQTALQWVYYQRRITMTTRPCNPQPHYNVHDKPRPHYNRYLPLHDALQ